MGLISELDGRQYLVTVDYFSSFIEVDYLTSTTAKDVIIKLQVHFSRYGIPSEIVSDQGPQFTSTQFHSMVKWGIVHTTQFYSMVNKRGIVHTTQFHSMVNKWGRFT